ncbi:MAG: hypothetical protein K6F92_09355 [Lachnospiraceae bacterium]|nr:hypothetical protein [Lachnospiraceae bacterium]
MNKSTKSGKLGTPVKPVRDGLIKLPEGWIYMNDKDVSISQIAACIKELAYPVDCWHEAGVCEVEFGLRQTMDFEELELPFEEEFSDAFVSEHGFVRAYYVTFPAECFDKAREVAAHVKQGIGGGFYADTDDFKPEM